MVLHASAFTLFAFSIAIFTCFYANYLFKMSKFASTAFFVSEIVMYVLSFFSQLLLCLIFLQLGTRIVLVESFDETADEKV
jgi:hypothetical protein